MLENKYYRGYNSKFSNRNRSFSFIFIYVRVRRVIYRLTGLHYNHSNPFFTNFTCILSTLSQTWPVTWLSGSITGQKWSASEFNGKKTSQFWTNCEPNISEVILTLVVVILGSKSFSDNQLFWTDLNWA